MPCPFPHLPSCAHYTVPSRRQHVWVHADVVDLATGTEQRTNDFRFTWCREDGPPLKRTVVPKTYGGMYDAYI